MNIRLISGIFKNHKIISPNSRQTHPMSERARNAIFNSIQPEIQDAEVLDAFAGTGALGLEAISRGVKLIRSSVSSWLNSSGSRLERGDLLENLTFDVIFADPPYYDPQFSTIKKLSKRLKSGGILILSQPKEIENFEMENLTLISEKKYSGAKILFFRSK